MESIYGHDSKEFEANVFHDERYTFTADVKKSKAMKDQQKQLLEDIRWKFDPAENDADLCILFEISDYKDLEKEREDFWESYCDFYNEIGLVREDKLDKRALNFVERKSYEKMETKRVFSSSIRPNTARSDDSLETSLLSNNAGFPNSSKNQSRPPILRDSLQLDDLNEDKEE